MTSSTSSPNESFAGDQSLMDLSLKNFWFIVHYPCSDPGSEFEILSKRDLVLMDSWDVLEKGASITVKYGCAKVHGIVVTVSDDFKQLSDNFQHIVDEWSENEFLKKRRFDKNRSSLREIIKVADKETQTEIDQVDYLKLKRQFEKLQEDYNRMHTLISGVRSGLLENVATLDNITNESLGSSVACGIPEIKQNVLTKSNQDNVNDFDEMVQIGSGGTKITRSLYNSIKWTSYSAATRKLLTALFPRVILATQSLTGKPSPAFISTNKPGKTRLDPKIISDIIEIVTRKSMVSESLVRGSITTKCADENKMYKRKMMDLKYEPTSSTANCNSNNKENVINPTKRMRVVIKPKE